MKPLKRNLRRGYLRRNDRRAGFSLVEALAALAVTGSVAATALPFLGRLIDRWPAAEASIQRQDQWMQAMLRLSEDIGEALPLALGPRGEPAFRADPQSVSFARETRGPRGALRLEAVRWIIEPGERGDRLLRAAGPFTPENFASTPAGSVTELLAGPFRLAFVLVESGGRRSRGWPGGTELPLYIELSVAPLAGAPRDIPAKPLALSLGARTAPSGLAAKPAGAEPEPGPPPLGPAPN